MKNKKRLAFLGTLAIAPVAAFAFVSAVSCTKTLTAEELKTELDKVEVSFAEGKTIAELEADKTLVTSTGFDDKKVKVVIESVTAIEGNDKKAKVTFKVVDLKKESNASESRELEVELKEATPVTPVAHDFTEALAAVKLDYTDKANTLPAEFKVESLTKEGFDAAKYEFVFVKNEAEGQTVKVTFKLQLIETKEVSAETTVSIEGFKEETPVSTKLTPEELGAEKDKVTITPADDKTADELVADASLLTFAGFDTEKVKVANVAVVKGEGDKVKVSYEIVDLKDETNKLEVKDVEVTAKKAAPVAHDFTTALAAVKLDYTDKANTLPADFKVDSLTKEGVDAKYEFVFVRNEAEGQTVKVTFKLKLTETGEESAETTITIDGFKAA